MFKRGQQCYLLKNCKIVSSLDLQTPFIMINPQNFFHFHINFSFQSSLCMYLPAFSFYSLTNCTKSIMVQNDHEQWKNTITHLCSKMRCFRLSQNITYILKNEVLPVERPAEQTNFLSVHRNMLCTNELLSLVKFMRTIPCLRWSNNCKIFSSVHFFFTFPFIIGRI